MQCALLSINKESIQALIEERGWRECAYEKMVAEVYDYVRNEILFGYNEKDDLSGSRILSDGIGQCNTKSTLLMTLYQTLGVETRLHAFYVDKTFQKELIGPLFPFVPSLILHTWVEINYFGEWIALEGVIMDDAFVAAVKNTVDIPYPKPFLGYAIAVEDLEQLDLSFSGQSTYVQKEAIVEDLGIYQTPSELYQNHQQNLGAIKNWIYVNAVQQSMNNNVKNIRNS